MDEHGIQVFHIKSEVLNTIRHNMLPVLKYPGNIDQHNFMSK